MVEEEIGMRKKRSELEVAAEEWAVCFNALKNMERMDPRPSEAIFEMNRQFLRENEEKLRRLEDAGVEDVETAKRMALDEQTVSDIERDAIVQEMQRRNPGQRNFELGGAETQEIYEKIAAVPKTKTTRADKYTCAFCGKTRADKALMCCSRCKMVSYCSKECQISHWKHHKKECKDKEKEPKSLPLTWEQLEAHGPGVPVSGEELEVKAMMEEGMVRQVLQCKDRVGTIRRIAAYTDSRTIPGLTLGRTLRWKNPRFHYFMDGSSGARIEEEDLVNITVKK
jgi:hypothetical protein